MVDLKPEFWVVNISKRDVSLADLNLTIRAKSSVNLLSNNYHFTLEQLEKSLVSGSIFNKRDKIKKRKAAPSLVEASRLTIDLLSIPPSKSRSFNEIKEEKIEELEFLNKKEISIEEYISQTGDDQ